jgi:hypothetical protein
MEYKFLDPAENVGLPKPLKYAGLYSEDTPYYKTKWSKDYRGAYVPPDAVSYSSRYFELARNHIPTGIRPGNNTILNSPYKFYDDKLNGMCFAGN